MDPLPPTQTGHSPQNEADTQQTRDLKHLRAKRVAYYKSIRLIKADSSKVDSQPVSTASQDTKGKPSENQAFKLRGLQKSPCYSGSGKESVLLEESQGVPGEAEQDLGQRASEGYRTRSCSEELDLQMLADSSVPETQKLQHVINWAQKFLSNSQEEQGLKSPKTSLGLLHSNLCQSVKAVGNQKDVHQRSSDSPPLLRGSQSSPQINLQSFSLSPPKNSSEMGLSTEFSGSFLKLDFPGNLSCGCQETAVKNEREEGATVSPADSSKQAGSAQQKCDRAGNRQIQNPNEEDTFPERLRIQTQLRDTSEERKVLEETGQSPPRSSYFWAPLSDSSEEECFDEPGDSKGTFRRGVQGRKCEEFVGIAFSSTSVNKRVSQTTMLESGDFSPGDTPLETDMRGNFRGAVSIGTPKGVLEEFKMDSSRGHHHIAVPIQRLPRVQLMSPCDSSKGRGKESDNMRSTLGSPHSDINSRNEWKCGTVEREGESILRRVPGGSQNIHVQRSVKGSPPGITQRQLDVTQPESCPAPQTASLSLNLSEDPLENVAVHECSASGVSLEPIADSHSTWFSQLPPPGADSPSVQPPRVVTKDMTQEQKEKIAPSRHPVSRGISKNDLIQDVGDGPSWSVVETYFYYLHVLNKIRGHSSEEENFSFPVWRPGLSESGLKISPLEGKGSFKGASLDGGTKEWKDGSESNVDGEREGNSHPQGQGCAEEAALQDTSFWKPQSKHDLKTFQEQVLLEQRREAPLRFIQGLLLLDLRRNSYARTCL